MLHVIFNVNFMTIYVNVYACIIIHALNDLIYCENLFYLCFFFLILNNSRNKYLSVNYLLMIHIL